MKAFTRSAIFGLVLLLLCGCAARTIPQPTGVPRAPVPPPSPVPPPAPAPPPSPVSPPAPVPPPVPAVPTAESNYVEGLALMQQGKFERALELFTAAWKEKPGHPGVEENFPEALEGLKKNGDVALQNGRPEDAGKKWMAALALLPHPALKGRSLSFAKADLKTGIDKLSEKLMEKGLENYRNGQLESAIAAWRQILVYDPSHEEATKSVRTATTQLENLKKIPSATGK